MEALTIAVTGLLCIICFIIGAKVGQTVSKGEDIELPEVNPMKAIKEHRAKQEAEMEQNRIDTIMRNIESYDGTTMGQEDVPRR
jgi:hypothetical protein